MRLGMSKVALIRSQRQEGVSKVPSLTVICHRDSTRLNRLFEVKIVPQMSTNKS